MIIEKNQMPRMPDIDLDEITPAERRRLIEGFTRVHHIYRSAMKVASTQLENLDNEFTVASGHSPIHHIESRVKTIDSIVEKLKRKGLPLTPDGMRSINDIAGIRVVCNYANDVRYMYNLIKRTQGFKVISERDYITEPKPSGYRSMHIVVSVPVTSSGGTIELPVEIQLRSIAMDLWASLEHELRYKSNREFSAEDEARLKKCAETLAFVDQEMQDLFLQAEDMQLGGA